MSKEEEDGKYKARARRGQESKCKAFVDNKENLLEAHSKGQMDVSRLYGARERGRQGTSVGIGVPLQGLSNIIINQHHKSVGAVDYKVQVEQLEQQFDSEIQRMDTTHENQAKVGKGTKKNAVKSLFGNSNSQKAKVAREMASNYRQIAQHEDTIEGATAEETVRDRSNKIATTVSTRQRERERGKGTDGGEPVFNEGVKMEMKTMRLWAQGG